MDFEKQVIDIENDRGEVRTNRVFRQLVVCPSMYWENANDSDAFYLKNKKAYVSTNIEKIMGGTLEMSKNNASVVFVDLQGVGDIHPKNSMLSEIILLVTHEIYEMAQDKRKLSVNDNDTINMPTSKFNGILLNQKRKYQELWSKEYREISDEKYLLLVKEYMKKWLMIKEEENQIIIYPSLAITSGKYSDYMEDKLNGK